MTKFRKENADKLLELYFSGKLDEQYREIVQGWLISDEGRKEKDANIAMLFEKIMSEKRKPDEYTRRSLAAMHDELGFTERNARLAAVPLLRRKSLRYLVGATVAAVLTGVFVLSDMFTATMPEPVDMADVRVVAEPSSANSITLPDGSTVRLKESTSITYAGNFAENRSVKIDGEAYFVVVRDEKHPFTVEGNEVTVTVLGTEFNMKAFEADAYAEVILTTGKIQITSGDESVTLSPCEKATVNRSLHTIELGEINEGEMLRFRGMSLSFEDITLDDAFRLIGGYYGATIKAAVDIPAIDGIVMKLSDDADLSETLLILQAINPVFDYDIENGAVVITKRR